jgi:hypothetical protein
MKTVLFLAFSVFVVIFITSKLVLGQEQNDPRTKVPGGFLTDYWTDFF